MSQTSISDKPDRGQGNRKRLQDARYIDLISAALYRFDRRDPDADFYLLDSVTQDKYRNDAAVVAYMRDREESTPAFYLAADVITKGALGSFPRLFRLSLITFLDVAFCAYRKALARSADIKLHHLDLLAKLAEADRQAAEDVKTPAAPESLSAAALAEMVTGKEVH